MLVSQNSGNGLKFEGLTQSVTTGADGNSPFITVNFTEKFKSVPSVSGLASHGRIEVSEVTTDHISFALIGGTISSTETAYLTVLGV